MCDTTAEFVALADPAVVWTPGSLDALLAATRRWPRGAAFGPLIQSAQGTVYPSARAVPSLSSGIGHALFGRWLPNNRWTRAYRHAREVPAERTTGWLVDTCVLLRRDAFDAIGGFEADDLVYLEDLELGERFAKAGWHNVYVPSAVVVGGSRQRDAIDRARLAADRHRSVWAYLSRRYAGWRWWPVRVVLRAGLGARAAVARWLGGGRCPSPTAAVARAGNRSCAEGLPLFAPDRGSAVRYRGFTPHITRAPLLPPAPDHPGAELRPDRPNRADRRLPGGAAGIAAAIAAGAAIISAGTTGTSGDGTPTGGSTPVPPSPPPTALSTAASPTDSGAPSALPTDSTPVTSAGPSTTAPSTPPSSTRPVGRVGIHLSFYDWSATQQVAEVGANVEGKVIRDGSCTLTLRLGSVVRTASRRAIITPSSTSCGVLSIPGSKLGPGDWTAVVSFTAPTARGSSDPVTITVPR